MTDDRNPDTEEDKAATPAAEPEPEKKPGSSKMLFVILAVVVVLIGAAVAVLFFTNFGKKLRGIEVEEPVAEASIPAKDIFFEIDEMVVNLMTNRDVKKPPFLRLNITLEVESEEDMKNMEIVKPRIVDSFQVYLRQLRMEDLEGSAGIMKLKEELLRRANEAGKPIKVKKVLLGNIIMQ